MAVPLSLIIWFTFNDSPSSKNYPLSSESHISSGALWTSYYCTWRILFQEEAVVLESRQIGDVVGTCQGMDSRKERKERVRDFLVFKCEQLGECLGCG